MDGDRPTQQALREQTQLALLQAVAEEENETLRNGPPTPGDLFAFPEGSEVGVEWVVLDRRPGQPGRFLVVPADTNPLIGSEDLALPPKTALVLRCGFGLWLEEEAFAAAHRSGRVEEPMIRRALEKWTALEEGRYRGDPDEREVDAESDYEDWREGFLEPAHRALRQEGRAASDSNPEPQARRSKSASRTWVRAASFLIAGIGLAGIVFQSLRLSRLSQPLRIERVQEVFLGGGVRGAPSAEQLPGDGPLLLTLVFSESLRRHSPLFGEITNLTSGKAWQFPELEPGATEISLVLPVSFLKAGNRVVIRILHRNPQGELETLEEKVLVAPMAPVSRVDP